MTYSDCSPYYFGVPLRHLILKNNDFLKGTLNASVDSKEKILTDKKFLLIESAEKRVWCANVDGVSSVGDVPSCVRASKFFMPGSIFLCGSKSF